MKSHRKELAALTNLMLAERKVLKQAEEDSTIGISLPEASDQPTVAHTEYIEVVAERGT